MIRHHKKGRFLAALREVGNVTEAARLAGVHRTSHYVWRKDPAYAAEADDAMEEAADHLEAEARRRAVEGVAEPIFYQGVPVGTVQKYSDVLLIFLLKAARPEKYRERIEHYGADRFATRVTQLAETLGLDPAVVLAEVERLREEAGT